MIDAEFANQNIELIELLQSRHLSPLDLIPHRDLQEKLVELVLNGIPETADYESSVLFNELGQKLNQARVDQVNVVVFGGGTGLSNVIGGDCRQKGWVEDPFNGLKQVFPQTRAIVCITDDGGATGELLKDLPVIAVGDIRHVLLSSIQQERLQKRYELTAAEARQVVGELATFFNYRFDNKPKSAATLLYQSGMRMDNLPKAIRDYIAKAIAFCFRNDLCRQTLTRSHCLGNLLVLAAICRNFQTNEPDHDVLGISDETAEAIYDDLNECALVLGAIEDGVLPCAITPAQLRFLYTNGVQVTGEKKSSQAQRGFPVDRVFTDFCAKPNVSKKIFEQIQRADILIMAPGSLYSSIIPVLQVPGIAEAVRENKKALKLLISNLWVQAGETDKSLSDPERKFHISDMIRAYERNLPGGTRGLFDQVLCLSLKDVPASVIQSYAVEGKIPIYLDRDFLRVQGFETVECGFFSKSALIERNVIQHDPHIIAQAVKTLFLSRKLVPDISPSSRPHRGPRGTGNGSRLVSVPSSMYRKIEERIDDIPVIIDRGSARGLDEKLIRNTLVDILWSHRDIPVTHLENIRGVACVREEEWPRDQRWDNVFSFYDPDDCCVKIRRDRFQNPQNLEVAFLITVGQALLGDYAAEKKTETLTHGSVAPGTIFHLQLKDASLRTCYFTESELREYLMLARMIPQSKVHFTRLINGVEGFTPPGLLMGVMYAWYLDNRLASHIEYKMSVMKVRQTDLIPEQMKTRKRREGLVTFFREIVFGKDFKMLY